MNINKYIQDNLKLNSDAGIACVDTLMPATVDVTLWGGLRVSVEGYEGSIALDTLTKEFFNEVKKCAYEQDDVAFYYGHRKAGLKLDGTLRELYKISDTKLSQKNWFTKLCHLGKIILFVLFLELQV